MENGARGVDGDLPEGPGAPGEPQPAEDVPPRRPRRRWAWTLVFAGLVPTGAVLLVAGGGPYGNAVVRIVGGSLLGVAVVIVLWLLASGDAEDEPDEEGSG